MPFVLDASVAICWALDDEVNPLAEIALRHIHKDDALVPGLWWFEIRNGLIINERRKRLTEADTSAFLLELSHLAVNVDYGPDEGKVLSFARHYHLTIYDAAYLELARRKQIPLATSDAALVRAARAEKVELLGK